MPAAFRPDCKSHGRGESLLIKLFRIVVLCLSGVRVEKCCPPLPIVPLYTAFVASFGFARPVSADQPFSKPRIQCFSGTVSQGPSRTAGLVYELVTSFKSRRAQESICVHNCVCIRCQVRSRRGPKSNSRIGICHNSVMGGQQPFRCTLA